MDGSKRRRTNSGDDVTDAEVEEFYAILRRIFLASKSRRPVQSPPATWNPSFAPEDFQVRKDERPVAVGPQRDATEVQRGDGAPAVRRLLDLNEDPEPDEVSGPTSG
ncbi:hypothetical protein LUZ61_004507 [Rhynchospora tenuis]|uniref:Uncharacterized protein n=1 Tax=Rhynchospora tenuis TaxID=198213 RepID=A0AAD5ZMU0_9POAL|nr:hypothetical protein LUZ61_004507 [Rhynchospora tenuis]